MSVSLSWAYAKMQMPHYLPRGACEILLRDEYKTHRAEVLSQLKPMTMLVPPTRRMELVFLEKWDIPIKTVGEYQDAIN